MPTLGDRLKQCRKGSKAKKLVLGDIALACDKDIGYLSKVENNKFDDKKVAAAFSRKDISKLAELFRDNLVSEGLIEDLENAFTNTRIAIGKSSDEESEILQNIYETLQELDEGEKRGYLKELEQRNYLWHGIHVARSGFNPEGTTYKKSFQEIFDGLEALEVRDKESTYNFRARNQLSLGLMLRYLGRVTSAETKLSNAVELAQESGDGILIAKALRERGDFYRRSKQQNLNLALEDYQQALHIFETRKDMNGKSTLQLRVASVLLTAGQPKNALAICLEVSKYVEMGRNEYLERKSLEYTAWAYSILGEIDKALELQKRAHKITLRTNQPAEIAKSLTYLAGYYFLCGLLSEAENSYEDANENIGELLRNMGKSPQALRQIGKGDEAHELLIQCSIKLGLGEVKIHWSNGRAEARDNLAKSINMADQSSDQISKGRALMHLGELDLLEGDQVAARKNFTKAHAIFESTGLLNQESESKINPYFMCKLELNYVTMEHMDENYPEAIVHLEKAKKLAADFGLQVSMFEVQLWEVRLAIITDDKVDADRIAKLFVSLIDKAIGSGPYISKFVLLLMSSVLESAYQKNLKLASHVCKAILKHEQAVIASAVLFDESQLRVVENWYKRLNNLISEHEAIEKVSKTKRKVAN